MDDKTYRLYAKYGIDTDIPFCANHIRVLAVACYSHSPSLRSVAGFLGLSKPTIVRAMDRLEAHDLATRKRNPDDGRDRLLVPTKRGRAFEKAMKKAAAKAPRFDIAAPVRRLGAESLLP